MRLWHIDLIPYLPKSQLIAQWRELNSIFKKQDNHILINYVYNYSKDALYYYSQKVINQFRERNIEINCESQKKKKTNLKFCFYFVCGVV